MGRRHRWNSVFGNAIAALSDGGGSDPGVDDPSAFLINTDFNFPDVDTLRAALANTDIFDVGNNADPSTFEFGDMDEHGALKLPLAFHELGWKRVAPSNAVWLMWDMRVPPTLLQAHENAGGNYTDTTPQIYVFGLYENVDIEDQGFSDLFFAVHGDPAVVSVQFDLYSYFTNYDGNGTVVNTIPFDQFRDLSKHEFAMLVENFYSTPDKISGIRARIWHRGSPMGSGWVLLTELNLSKEDVSPDAFEAWRFLVLEAGVNANATDETTDYLNIGTVKLADAQINFDPAGVGVTADPAVLSAPEGASFNVPIAFDVDDVVITEDFGFAPVNVTSARNALGLEMLGMSGVTPTFDRPDVREASENIAVYARDFADEFTGVRAIDNGDTDITIISSQHSDARVPVVIHATVSGQTGLIERSMDSYADPAAFLTEFASAGGHFICGMPLAQFEFIDGMMVGTGNPYTGTGFGMGLAPHNQALMPSSNAFWARVQAVFDMAYLTESHFLDTALRVEIDRPQRGASFQFNVTHTNPVFSGLPSGIDDVVTELHFENAVGPADAICDGTLKDFAFRQVADMDALTYYIELYYQGVLVHTTPVQTIADSDATEVRFGFGSLAQINGYNQNGVDDLTARTRIAYAAVARGENNADPFSYDGGRHFSPDHFDPDHFDPAHFN